MKNCIAYIIFIFIITSCSSYGNDLSYSIKDCKAYLHDSSMRLHFNHTESNFQPNVNELNKIIKLTLQNMQNKDIGEYLTKFVNLKELHLSAIEQADFNYDSLFYILSHNSTIEKIRIGSCNIDTLSENLSEFKKLKTLILDIRKPIEFRENAILHSVINFSISFMGNIANTTSNNSNDVQLPRNMHCFPNLRNLSLDNINMKEINNIDYIRDIAYLLINNKSMHEIPKYISEMKNLKSLVISEAGNIEHIPCFLSGMECLKTVILRTNTPYKTICRSTYNMLKSKKITFMSKYKWDNLIIIED